jgi:hypothetical protein
MAKDVEVSSAQAAVDAKAARLKVDEKAAEAAAVERKKARKGKHFVALGCAITCAAGLLKADDEVTPVKLHRDPAVGLKALEKLVKDGKVVAG